MKVMLLNCHGKMEIAPDFKSIPIDKSVIFLCKEGKTLSVDQVKEFVNHLLAGKGINYAITHSSLVATDKHISPKEVLDIYSNLKTEEKNIKDSILLKIACLKIKKLDNFLQSMFEQHTKVERIIPNLMLSYDDVPNGAVSQIIKHLENNNFTKIGIAIYGNNNVVEKEQLYLMCDFQKLKNTNKADIIYITPSEYIKPLKLSYYLEKFSHAYLFYNNTEILEAFLNLQSDNKHLTDINSHIGINADCHLYDFGQENSNIVVGACREYDGFSFDDVI